MKGNSKTWTLGLNRTRGMDECPHHPVLMLTCVSRGFQMGRSPVEGVLTGAF
jgi:hypothetical protein